MKLTPARSTISTRAIPLKATGAQLRPSFPILLTFDLPRPPTGPKGETERLLLHTARHIEPAYPRTNRGQDKRCPARAGCICPFQAPSRSTALGVAPDGTLTNSLTHSLSRPQPLFDHPGRSDSERDSGTWVADDVWGWDAVGPLSLALSLEHAKDPAGFGHAALSPQPDPLACLVPFEKGEPRPGSDHRTGSVQISNPPPSSISLRCVPTLQSNTVRTSKHRALRYVR